MFPVEIYLDKVHENLLPGLTVSCRIIIDKLEDVLYIPIEAIRSEAGKNFVNKKSGGGYDKVEVETGRSNSDFTIITSGLDEGDVIALVDPFSESESDKKTTTDQAKQP